MFILWLDSTSPAAYFETLVCGSTFDSMEAAKDAVFDYCKFYGLGYKLHPDKKDVVLDVASRPQDPVLFDVQ